LGGSLRARDARADRLEVAARTGVEISVQIAGTRARGFTNEGIRGGGEGSPDVVLAEEG